MKEEIPQLNQNKGFCTHNTQYLRGRHLVGPAKENTKRTQVRKHNPGTEGQQNIWGAHGYRQKARQKETHKMLCSVNQAWARERSA